MKTMTVRVLVATTDGKPGHYVALGDNAMSDREVRAALNEQVRGIPPLQDLIPMFDPPVLYHWVEAEVPVPDRLSSRAIRGRVRG